MINTKKLVANVSDVPSYWAFQYYLNLDEKLTGQDIKIKSIFNPSERTPSMCLYVDKAYNIDGTQAKQYVYKDFSTGKFGNKIHLVKYLFNLSFSNAVEKLINDYNSYVKNEQFDKLTFVKQSKWKLDFAKTRQWNNSDANYWLQYNIGSSMLNSYNVRPIEYYNLVQEEQIFKVTGQNMYGYFDKNKELYKIYRPLSNKYKFFKVKNYLQGLDQLTYNKPYLVICSSLKDSMSLKSIGYNVDVISPDSENTIIKPYVINNLVLKYQKVITLFDNDAAGINAVKKYKETYNINGIVSPLSKDISDAIKNYGVSKVHKELKPLLKQIIHE